MHAHVASILGSIFGLFCLYFTRKYVFWGQIRLVWQIWPSGQELGSQPQAPGSIPPSPLMGSLCDLCGILVGCLWDPCGIQPLC